MSKEKQKKYEPIDASPVKSFFVSMLTRDIKLEEAILDLLDNCVDGILRNETPSKGNKHPYEGFWAKINFSRDTFEINDNCGGIPWKLHNYAFRMGRDEERPDEKSGTVGVYGIGMKRAIFKMGESALISTQNGDDRYEVDITPEWIRDEKAWRLPVEPGMKKSADGTTIIVGDLYAGISARFHDDKEDFQNDLERMIASHYAFIIEKGFEVKINGKTVKPRPTHLIFSKKTSSKKGSQSIQPFIWKTEVDDVEVFLSVGFTRPIPSAEEVDREQEQSRYASIDAGWTVVCNDRAVLYSDRTELTGWGEANVPRYHTQFIAISGIVEFRAKDAGKLPTTTTKRGIDASSRLYLQVKNKMREGTKIFTDYTYRWKGMAEEAKAHIASEPALSLDEIKEKAKSMKLSETKKSSVPGRQFVPSLPMPSTGRDSSVRKISFTREREKIEIVSEYLFRDSEREPSEVGEKCFDLILKEAKKK